MTSYHSIFLYVLLFLLIHCKNQIADETVDGMETYQHDNTECHACYRSSGYEVPTRWIKYIECEDTYHVSGSFERFGASAFTAKRYYQQGTTYDPVIFFKKMSQVIIDGPKVMTAARYITEDTPMRLLGIERFRTVDGLTPVGQQSQWHIRVSFLDDEVRSLDTFTVFYDEWGVFDLRMSLMWTPDVRTR